ncbi:MAG: hypothetical protein NDI95_16075 [Acidovorax soli]|uniref:hypothetical protein n=1 Tax=Acidovorax soli TaxID=592050 RepID=UPI0026F00054|nr:hypothetical protein [Acidovorax soli]MCM2348125.1 hypothetical protein [Acidovorax soli]
MSLSWHDAIAASGMGISHEDAALGWPKDMFFWRVAMLQRPSISDEGEAKAAKLALFRALCDAADAGALPYVQRPLELSFSGLKRDIHGTNYGVPYDRPRTGISQEKYATAADVVTWLKSIGETPSKHIDAWHRATTAASASPSELADFTALVAYRKSNTKGEGRSKKGPSWALVNQIDVGKAELARRIEAGTTESAALNAMGRELGIGGAEPRTPLKRALFGNRKRSSPKKTASPLPGVLQVRDGKKAA